jgi:hypothetical protein
VWRPGPRPYPCARRFGTVARLHPYLAADAVAPARAQNRQGGAPRGPTRFAPGGCVSQTWGRVLRARSTEDTASRRSSRPSLGAGIAATRAKADITRRSVKRRRGEKRKAKPGRRKRAAGTKKTACRCQGYGGLAYLPAEASAKAGALFDIVKME